MTNCGNANDNDNNDSDYDNDNDLCTYCNYSANNVWSNDVYIHDVQLMAKDHISTNSTRFKNVYNIIIIHSLIH